MSVTIRPGIYLEDNPPTHRQFRTGRRAKVKSVIVVHTAESGTDLDGPDPKAESVARFIRTRTDAGSYHLLGDADSIIQLVRFENEAFHDGTGSNRWSVGIALAMNAADWVELPIARAGQLVDTGGQMAAIAARWMMSQGIDRPIARKITKVESDRADANGFIPHAWRDPVRRTDPGVDFPWDAFFDAYLRWFDVVKFTTFEDSVRQLQAIVGADVDGDPGPQTINMTLDRFDHLNRLTETE